VKAKGESFGGIVEGGRRWESEGRREVELILGV